MSREKLMRKKKKNILTEEQQQKKAEMDERRRAHIQRVAEEQKRSVIEKILNVEAFDGRRIAQRERR